MTWVQKFLPSVLGVLAGVGGAYWAPVKHAPERMHGSQAQLQAPQAPPTAAAARTTTPELPSAAAPVIVVAPANSGVTQAGTEPPVAHVEQSPAEVRRDFQEQLAQHSRDARDVAWAGPSENSLTASLRAVTSGSGGELEQVDCRTSSCVASFKWESPEAAHRNYRQLLLAQYEPNCATRTVLAEQPGGGSYRSQLIFDCVSARANE